MPVPDGLGEDVVAAGPAARALEAAVGRVSLSAASLLSTFFTGGGTGGASAAVLDLASEAAVGA